MKDLSVIRFWCRIMLAVVCVAGCGMDDGLTVVCGDTVLMQFQPMEIFTYGTGTKAVEDIVDEGIEDGYNVSDFWLFEYDSDNTLLGAPRYYTTDDFDFSGPVPVSVILPSASGVIYKLAVIANTHNPSLLSAISYNTLGALKTSSLPVRSSADLYMGDELLMNAVVDISSSTSEVMCLLHRNVAKLSLNINNDESSGITINSVQIRNVPDRLFLLDRLYDEYPVSPDPSSVKFKGLEKDLVDLSEGESSSLLYYLPRNMRGTNSSTTEAGKNVEAPEHATYIEVIGTRNVNMMPVAYIFYPGANDINDFNLDANCHYQVTLDFTMYGDANDNRVEDLSVVRLEESNSYIVNPDEGVRYVVPIENRINTFWKSAVGRLNAVSEDYLVGTGMDWVAEVIWQDVDEKVMMFCDEQGRLTDRYAGAADDRFFSFVTTDASIGNPCNVVVGVRRAGDDWSMSEDGYMWSWHLWLTDYDPDDGTGTAVSGKYVYPVAGGDLHRYSSFDDIQEFRDKDIFIMDRNLGAKGSTREDGWDLCTGMLYQYGRKDPFPSSDNVYDINGNLKSITNSVGPSDIYMSVISPMDFILQSPQKEGNWTTETSLRLYDWNDLELDALNGKGKSFFDPCPPGWKLPYNDIWMDFGTSSEVYAANWNSSAEAENQYKTNSSDAGWLVYLDGPDKSSETAYFPGSGLRNYETGRYVGGGNGTLWSAKPNNDIATYLYYDNNSVNYWRPSQSFYRHMGIPVRCMTDY